ncbi:MAG: transposase [Bacteroidetes bacterium SB0662_bin_6]|nr:transposase [Bacteroidetes bacterium SB0668_bin_1]MYE05244.1 transposase [Bacteroidetes bacterium SB0662_bin_6]
MREVYLDEVTPFPIMPELSAGHWVTGREIAGLPGAPGGHYDVSRWAYRHGVARRKRRGRGGGYEYAVGTMPAETQKALQSAPIYDESFSGDGAPGEPPAAEPLSMGPVKTARLDILAALTRWELNGYPTLTEARRRFVAAYRRREAGVWENTYVSIPDISIRSLYRWRKDMQGEKAKGCAGRPSGLTPYIMDAVLTQLYAGGSSATITNIHAALSARYGDEVPSLRSLQRSIRQWREKHKQAATYLDSPEKWRSKHQVAFGRMDEGVTRINQIWELDSTIADVALRAPSGEMRLRRYALVGVIDVWSRRVMYQLAPVSSSAAITQLLRRALLQWGVPEKLRLDNGRDYTSERVALLATALAIRIEHCRPFHPEEKPFIERAFRTVSTAMEMLPGYVGHSVAERQELRAREKARARVGDAKVDLGPQALSPAEMQAWLDNWAENDYGRRTHGSLGSSPWERANSWKGAVRRIEDERVLDVLYEPVSRGGMRTVLKRGIQIDHRWYVAPELGAHVGERVRCYRDFDDEARICVYGDDKWICWAVDAEGAERKEIAAEAKSVQRKALRTELEKIRSARRRTSAAAAWQEIAVARAEEAEKIKALPELAEAHTTAMTRAAEEAARAKEETLPALAAATDEKTERHIEELRARRLGEEKKNRHTRPAIWRDEQHRYEYCRMMVREGQERDLVYDDLPFIAGYEKGYRVKGPIRWRFGEKAGKTAAEILRSAEIPYPIKMAR